MVRKTERERNRVKAENEIGHFLVYSIVVRQISRIIKLWDISNEERKVSRIEKRKEENAVFLTSNCCVDVRNGRETVSRARKRERGDKLCERNIYIYIYKRVTIEQYASLERYPDDINEIITKRVSSSFFTHAPARSLTPCAMPPWTITCLLIMK